jgi:hypothetical protein
MSMDGRKAFSAEPPTAAWVQGKRWEDLIEAATSATEADDDRDLTPVSHPTLDNTQLAGIHSSQFDTYHVRFLTPLLSVLLAQPLVAYIDLL